MEQAVQFQEEAQSLEELVIGRMEAEQVHKALKLLSDDERYLMIQLYFEERTERELAEELGIYHNAIHKQKKADFGQAQKNFRKVLILGCAKCFFNVEVIERTKSSPLFFEKHCRKAVISRSTDTLAVLSERKKRHGGYAKTTCR